MRSFLKSDLGPAQWLENWPPTPKSQGLDFQSRAQTGVAGLNLAPIPALESLGEGGQALAACILGPTYSDLQRAVQAQKAVIFT